MSKRIPVQVTVALSAFWLWCLYTAVSHGSVWLATAPSTLLWLALLGLSAEYFIWGLVSVSGMLRKCKLLECLSQTQLTDGSPAVCKQLVVDCLYWLCFSGLVFSIALLVFIPQGPVDDFFHWLEASMLDANLCTRLAGPPLVGKALVAGYLLWCWQPGIRGLSSLLARFVLQSSARGDRSCTVGELVLEMVRSETHIPVSPVNAFYKNCLLSLLWLSLCFGGWVALAWYHPTAVGRALAREFDACGPQTIVRYVPSYPEPRLHWASPTPQASSGPVSPKEYRVHEHYLHLTPASPRKMRIVEYLPEDLNTPMALFLTCMAALWITPVLSITLCVWLPLRRRPKLTLCAEGLILPPALSPSWRSPIRLWENIQSWHVSSQTLVLEFCDGGSVSIGRAQLQAEHWRQLASSLDTHAPRSSTSEILSLSCDDRADEEKVSPVDSSKFVSDNLKFVSEFLEKVSLGRSLLLATPLAIILLVERLLLLITRDSSKRMQVSAVCRTVLKNTMEPANRYSGLLYASTFIAPLLVVFCPKFILVPMVAVCLVASGFLALSFNDPAAMNATSQLGGRLKEFVLNMKPFLLWGLYVSGVGGLLIMAMDAVAPLWKRMTRRPSGAQTPSALVLAQNKCADADLGEYNFYHSSAFPVTMAAVYLLAVPTLIVYSVFWSAQSSDQWMWYWSQDPEVSPFLLKFAYFGGLGCMISALFFRAWFGLLAKHASTEYDITLDERGARQSNVKGWFADFLFYGWGEFFPRELQWSSVVAIDYEEKGFGTLTPLPDAIFRRGSRVHRWLTNYGAFTDAYTEAHGRARNIVLRTRYDRAFGHGIRIKLQDLNSTQRKQVLDALHRWAYQAEFDQRAVAALAA
jgi:hypothetical protein